jgi:glutamate-1-semialdehyde 2,1-aminomutase
MHDIEAEYRRLHPGSAALSKQALQVFPSGLTHDTRRFDPFPIYVERAQGSHKWDADGNEIIDYVMGHGALLTGHGQPDLVAAVQKQMGAGTHYGASHHLEIEWAKAIIDLIPSGEKVRLHSSGTEATMMAIRLARAFTGRSKLIKFEDHFHGWHDVVSGATVPDSPIPAAFGVARQTMETLYSLPPGDIGAVRQALQSDNDIAAVIVEPTGAHYGQTPLDPTFLQQLRDVTQETGTILIFDEVVTGFRIAPGGAQERYGVTPDLTTLAKIVAGGLPGGAVTGRADIMSVLDFRAEERVTEGRVYHPGTFNGNPLSASAALVMLADVKAGAPGEAERRAGPIVPAMNQILASSGVNGAAWGHASILHVTLGHDTPRPDGFEWDLFPQLPKDPPAQLIMAFSMAMINRGVQFMGAGNAAFVSTVHSDTDVDKTLAAFEGAIGDLQKAGLV